MECSSAIDSLTKPVDPLTKPRHDIGGFGNRSNRLMQQLDVKIHPFIVGTDPAEDRIVPQDGFVAVPQKHFTESRYVLYKRGDLLAHASTTREVRYPGCPGILPATPFGSLPAYLPSTLSDRP
jgi:hypothetical protein